MNLLTKISRILVGALFIVSGLIKANDPLGFSYKLQDYFAADVLGIEWMAPFALELAVIICVVEIIIGIAVLTGAAIRISSWALLLMIVFFTFLTFYSAYFNKVTDCGCFGDALKLTPWESFTKDVVLLGFVLVIFFRRKSIQINNIKEDLLMFSAALALTALFSLGVISWGFPVLFSLLTFAVILVLKKVVPATRKEQVVILISLLLSLGFSIYTIRHLPIRDFRPYAVGKNIQEGMTIPEGKQSPEYAVVYTMKNQETGEIKEVDSKKYISSGIWEDKSWEITETSDPILIKEGYTPPIHDFELIAPDGSDRTEEILNKEYAFLLITYDINNSDKGVQSKLNQFAGKAQENGQFFAAVSASLYDEVEDFRHHHQNTFDYYTADQITLKTIIRSNPGLVLLKRGTVIGKWHHNDMPEFEEVKNKYLN